jgi:hypothetical protein
MTQRIEDLTEPCGRCKAEAGSPCVNPETGKPAHMCCVVRLKKVNA